MARFIRYTTTANKTEYDISFDVTNEKGLEVWLDRNQLDESLDYKVIGTIDELRAGTGKIQLTSQPAIGKSLVVISNTEEKRVTNFAKAARFEEAEIDAEFNNLLRMLEDAILSLQSTPYFHPADIGIVNGRLPRIEPNGVIQVNAAGDGFEIVDLSQVPSFTDLVHRAEAAANKAEASEQAAKASENKSATHAQNADQSENAARASESNARQHAQDSERFRNETEQFKNQANGYKDLAEDWAVGLNPQPPQSQPSDTNNAYYYYVEAGKSANSAKASETAAGASNNLSRMWAVGPNPQPPIDQPSAQNNSLFWANESNRHKNASAASAAAAKASETSAAQDKTATESFKNQANGFKDLSMQWAVGPSGAGGNTPSDTNNAYYWAQEAQKAAGGGVSSVNGDTGTVIVSELKTGPTTRVQAQTAGVNILRTDSDQEVQINVINSQYGARLSVDANGRYRILQANKNGTVEAAWLVANRAGSVELNYNNVKKFETTSFGTQTTGNHLVDGQQISLANNQNTGAFLEIKSSNPNIDRGIKLIQHQNKTGYLQSSDGAGTSLYSMISWSHAGGVSLHFANNVRLTTTVDGIAVTGQGVFSRNGETVILKGTASGDGATPYLRFQQSDGASLGYVGYGSSTNQHMYIENAVGNVNIHGQAVSITDPYSNSPQGTDANSLTRRDFVEQELAKKATVTSGTADPVADGNTQEGDIYIKILP